MVTYYWSSPDFLVIECKGNVKGYNLIRAALEIASRPEFEDTHYVLCDWTQYRRACVRISDVRALVGFMNFACQTCPHVRHAVVNPPDNSGNAMPALYKLLGEELPWDIEIFQKVDAACDWLGSPQSSLRVLEG